MPICRSPISPTILSDPFSYSNGYESQKLAPPKLEIAGMNQLTPTVGEWYAMPGGIKFEVIDVDNGTGIIEVQGEDGLLGEVATDEWPRFELEHSTPPSDLANTLDSLSWIEEEELEPESSLVVR